MTYFDASIIGEKLDTTVQLPGEIQIGHGMASMHGSDTVYSARLALFIHGTTLAKRTRKFRPAVLVRESICWIQVSDTLHTHKSQKGSIEALNFLIIILT